MKYSVITTATWGWGWGGGCLTKKVNKTPGMVRKDTETSEQKGEAQLVPESHPKKEVSGRSSDETLEENLIQSTRKPDDNREEAPTPD